MILPIEQSILLGWYSLA